jgi:glycosyltransferase involved in cell wall biosynthesis
MFIRYRKRQGKLMNEKIEICICTYKRPELLYRLLKKIEQVILPEGFSISVLIVDNDYMKSGELTVKMFKEESGIEISYNIEPRQNIAMARNKVLNEATGDFLAFIDDDEFPSHDWLLKMYESLVTFNSDAVLGPVKPFFDFVPPHWISKTGHFERPEHKTGTILERSQTRSGNLFMRKNSIDLLNIRFDNNFSGGGEDRDFLGRMIDSGLILTWCNEGIVYEVIQKERCRISIQIRRALLRGKMAVRQKDFTPLHIIKSLVAIILYPLMLPFIFLFNRKLFYKFFFSIFDHLGKVLSLIHLNPIKEVYIS